LLYFQKKAMGYLEAESLTIGSSASCLTYGGSLLTLKWGAG
jgi:hypothetical protein